ncbi:DNA-binding transcriptional activator DecR [Paraburkholderia nemoris]|uniref:Lrp/AsnC family transcriptional regulator n=1 Tax=Paraburkholderia nemoris TaxID=2793076 RepID=UPI00190C2405|nr:MULTISPECIES: Lrp/AsnC family transcriptional regulator [Paraburkholderia]MBK3786663.1 Lrp/AsnC family transcriptional regulator [Paraburkholderia aspalathi]CAE6859605.1 DNA-binding transcriptional activator DecR [Paraburkholderia nemoris]
MDSSDLDDLDLKILAALQENASLSNHELATLVQSSAPTCSRRVAKLKSSGIILRTTVVIDQEKIAPVVTVIAEVTLDRQTTEDRIEFERLACAMSAVAQCYRVSAGPDFIVIVHLPNLNAYDDWASKLFRRATNIRNVRTFFATHVAKFESAAALVASPNDGSADGTRVHHT